MAMVARHANKNHKARDFLRHDSTVTVKFPLCSSDRGLFQGLIVPCRHSPTVKRRAFGAGRLHDGGQFP